MPVGPLPLALPEMTIRTSTDEGARAVDGNRDLATTLFFYRECPPPRITPHPGRFFLVSRRATFFTSVFSNSMYRDRGPDARIKSCNPKQNQIWDKSRNRWRFLFHSGAAVCAESKVGDTYIHLRGSREGWAKRV